MSKPPDKGSARKKQRLGSRPRSLASQRPPAQRPPAQSPSVPLRASTSRLALAGDPAGVSVKPPRKQLAVLPPKRQRTSRRPLDGLAGFPLTPVVAQMPPLLPETATFLPSAPLKHPLARPTGPKTDPLPAVGSGCPDGSSKDSKKTIIKLYSDRKVFCV